MSNENSLEDLHGAVKSLLSLVLALLPSVECINKGFLEDARCSLASVLELVSTPHRHADFALTMTTPRGLNLCCCRRPQTDRIISLSKVFAVLATRRRGHVGYVRLRASCPIVRRKIQVVRIEQPLQMARERSERRQCDPTVPMLQKEVR